MAKTTLTGTEHHLAAAEHQEKAAMRIAPHPNATPGRIMPRWPVAR
jgi:hypothetical protein